MNRKVAIFAAALMAFAFTAPGAQAGSHRTDKRLKAVSMGVGAAATAGYFAINHWHWHWDSKAAGISMAGASLLTTIGCAAVSPMVATVVLKRELTLREADVLVGSCVIPIIGGWLVNKAFDAHPEWEAADKPAHKWHKRRRHHKKM